jgi:hypothetical protein
MFLASTLFVFAFAFQTAAQPGGCYSDTWRSEYCREKRNELLQQYAFKIENLSKQSPVNRQEQKQAAEADEERAREALKNQKSYQPSDYCDYHTQ